MSSRFRATANGGTDIVQVKDVRKRSAVYILGFVHILLGITICVLETLTLALYRNYGAPGYPIEYAGIWTGIFAIITGIVQIIAGKKDVPTKTRRFAFLIGIGTTVVCILQALIMFAMSLFNIILVRGEISRRENRLLSVVKTFDSPLDVDQLKDLAMITSVVSLVYICLAILALASSIFNCQNFCGRRRPSAPPEQSVPMLTN